MYFQSYYYRFTSFVYLLHTKDWTMGKTKYTILESEHTDLYVIGKSIVKLQAAVVFALFVFTRFADFIFLQDLAASYTVPDENEPLAGLFPFGCGDPPVTCGIYMWSRPFFLRNSKNEKVNCLQIANALLHITGIRAVTTVAIFLSPRVFYQFQATLLQKY